MTEQDLNINNYNYNELLKLFSIKNNSFDDDLLTTKIIQIKTYFPNYYTFYFKAYKIISIINKLCNDKLIFHNNPQDIESCVNKLKLIDAFETQSIHNIINLLGLSYTQLSNNILITNPANLNIKEQIKTNMIDNTVNNPVAPGALNSIKRITQSLNLNLNSCFRHNYYSSNPCDFQYMLPVEIKNVVSLRLASIEIPNTWYLFSAAKKNNIFYIEINNSGVITEYQIIIPDGNYDDVSLTGYLNTTYFYLSGNTDDLSNIQFSILPYNFKSNFEIVGIHPDKFCITVMFLKDLNQNMMNTFGWTIGFRLANYKNITSGIYSEGLFDGGGDRYIYMSVDDYQYNNNTLNIVCFDKSILDKNIIAKIPMINGKLSLIIDDNTSLLTKTRKYNGPVNIRNLNIKILDQFGSIIDLNNMDFSFTFELEILYEGFNFKDINA
jgi:hypothetical protein